MMSQSSFVDPVDLLQGLVSIPSLSHKEHTASAWLVDQMAQLDYSRAYVDEAGNAVCELGEQDAAQTIVLLGHIDTVPGDIPVRIEKLGGDEALFGRGSVDAKGPLATFVVAASRVDPAYLREHDTRLIVVGAVEEEAATSRGARWIRDRFDGIKEAIPVACIIGEPSSWNRITLGYKGRLLLDSEFRQPMAHTAGPDAGIAVRSVELWNWVARVAAEFNSSRPKIFDQLQPSLREIHTSVDDAMHDVVESRIGIRVPVDFDANAFADDLQHYCTSALQCEKRDEVELQPGVDHELVFRGEPSSLRLTFRGYEPAWRSSRSTPLVRAFLNSIRQHGERPSFVVKTGTSDMNVVGPKWLCPILAYGPGDSALDHTPNEHLSLAEYRQAIDVLQQALIDLCQQDLTLS